MVQSLSSTTMAPIAARTGANRAPSPPRGQRKLGHRTSIVLNDDAPHVAFVNEILELVDDVFASDFERFQQVFSVMATAPQPHGTVVTQSIASVLPDSRQRPTTRGTRLVRSIYPYV
jgi:hypothetical protein